MSDVAALVIDHLRETVESLRLVAGAAGFATSSESNPAATPAAFVFLTGESGGEDTLDEPFIQRLEQTLAVVLVVRHAGGPSGAGAAAEMALLGEAVRTALRGFSPTEDYEPLRFQSAALVTFRDRHEWWQQTWQTASY